MKGLIVFLTVSLTSAAFAQVAISPRRAVKRLDMPPPPSPQQSQPAPATPAPRYSPTPVPAAPPKPTAIATKIEIGLAASPIKVVGTADGLAGRMYVTNSGQDSVTPNAQFAVLDKNGVQIATLSKKGEELPANGSAKMEVVSSNPNASDIKLLKLGNVK